MPFQTLRSLLPKAIKKAGLARQVEAGLVCQEFDELAKDIFKEISSQAKAIYFKDKILTIAVLNSVLAQEIKLRERYFIDKLNDKRGWDTVLGLRFLM